MEKFYKKPVQLALHSKNIVKKVMVAIKNENTFRCVLFCINFNYKLKEFPSLVQLNKKHMFDIDKRFKLLYTQYSEQTKTQIKT